MTLLAAVLTLFFSYTSIRNLSIVCAALTACKLNFAKLLLFVIAIRFYSVGASDEDVKMLILFNTASLTLSRLLLWFQFK